MATSGTLSLDRKSRDRCSQSEINTTTSPSSLDLDHRRDFPKIQIDAAQRRDACLRRRQKLTRQRALKPRFVEDHAIVALKSLVRSADIGTRRKVE